MQFEYDQTPLQRKIVVQEQIIKQMSDPRNKMFYSNEDLIKANSDLEKLNAAEQEYVAKMNSGGSKSKRYRRKSKSHRKYHMRSHKKSRKH
jgi:hypothetical protein